MSRRLLFSRSTAAAAATLSLSLCGGLSLATPLHAEAADAHYSRALSRISSSAVTVTAPCESKAAAAAAPSNAVAFPTSIAARWPNLYVIPETRAVLALFTILRDERTSHGDFAAAADRLMRLLAEEGLAALPGAVPVRVRTPVGEFEGLRVSPIGRVAAVSIVRAGDTLLEAARAVCPSLAAGKILIQRDEDSAQKTPRLFYVKLPTDIGSRAGVLLVDPMLATGQSAALAIRELLNRGVAEENIVFLNVVACPEGLDALFNAFPAVKVVTGSIDSHLNGQRYIVPGLGDFGDRYFGTTH